MVFFFSSRRRHTRCSRDWSSDVCSSDLAPTVQVGQTAQLTATPRDAGGNPLTGRVITWQSSNGAVAMVNGSGLVTAVAVGSRSEERRVGKEGRSRWSPYH